MCSEFLWMDFTSTCFYLKCLVGWCATCVEGAKLGEPGFCNPATDKIEVEWSYLVSLCAACVEGAKLGGLGFRNPATDKIEVEWSCLLGWCFHLHRESQTRGARLLQPSHRQDRGRVVMLSWLVRNLRAGR
jgi:hypothetical protein